VTQKKKKKKVSYEVQPNNKNNNNNQECSKSSPYGGLPKCHKVAKYVI
jgi:hypothetical protein